MTEPIQFSLSRRSLIVVAVSLVTSVLLFFSAGMVGALLLRQKPQSPVPTLFTARKPNLMPSPPALTRHTAAKPEARPRTPQLTLQVAAFEDQLKAQSFADSLQRQGFPILSLGTMQLADKTWRTVRVGPYSDWDTASNVASDLQRSYNLDVYVLLH